MTTLAQPPALFRTALAEAERAFSGDGAPDPFAELRRHARQHAETLGVPTRRDEAWKYTDLRAALAPEYAPTDAAFALPAGTLEAATIDGLDAVRVVLVGGHLRADLSELSDLPAGVTVGSLREAARAEGSAVATYFGKYVDVSRSAFAALNAASDLDGLFLHVGKNVDAPRAVHVVHVVPADAPTFVQSRHLVVAEANARVTLVETFLSASASGAPAETFRNELTEIVAGRGAAVEHVRIQDEGDAAHGVTQVQAYGEADAAVSTLTFTFASGTLRNNTAMVPAGPGGTATLGGLYLCHGAQHVDTSTLVDHVAPGCVSNELFRGVLFDRSTGVFNGKVFVRREGQQTNAYQQSQGVVLSPDARHFSKPELEIYADDVKCSHGSTTGSVDPEGVFYLRARGLSLADARALMLYAFAHDVVEMVSSEPVRDHLDARIEARLRSGQ